MKDDGTEEATGGKIRLSWQADGSFRAEGLHSNNVVEWEGTIRMSPEFQWSGTGRYHYIGATHHGTQQITYVPDARYFSVMGTSTSRTSATPFLHHWKRIAK